METTVDATLEQAFDRFADFLAVQSAQGPNLTLEAVELLQESVGITVSTRRLFAERLRELSENSDAGQVLLGLILGLIVADLEAGVTTTA